MKKYDLTFYGDGGYLDEVLMVPEEEVGNEVARMLRTYGPSIRVEIELS